MRSKARREGNRVSGKRTNNLNSLIIERIPTLKEDKRIDGLLTDKMIDLGFRTVDYIDTHLFGYEDTTIAALNGGTGPGAAEDGYVLQWNDSVNGFSLAPASGGGGITVNNQADNRIITATATTDTLNAESALTFDGSRLVLPDGIVAAPSLTFFGGGTNTGFSYNFSTIKINHTGVEVVRFASAGLYIGPASSIRNNAGGIIFDSSGQPAGGFEPPASSATVASGDLVMIWDIDDSNNPKQVTAQSIADLGGGGVSFGTNNQVPHMNAGGTDFDYDANLTWDGTRLIARNNTGNTTIGPSATNATTYATVVGDSASAGASASAGVALGYLASVESLEGIAIGSQAEVRGTKGIAIGETAGSTASAFGAASILIGEASADTGLIGADNILIGRSTQGGGANAIGIGQDSHSTGTGTIGIGAITRPSATGAMAFGTYSAASATGAIMIGYRAAAAQTNSVANSLEVAWDGNGTWFKTGETIGTFLGSDSDPATNLTDAIEGSIVYDSANNAPYYYDGANWQAFGGGGSVSFGTTTQVPYMNGGGTDFLYSADLTYDGTTLTVADTIDVGNLRFAGALIRRVSSGEIRFEDNITPNVSGAPSLGQSSLVWGAAYVDNILIDGNTISSTDTNGDINLTPDGTGDIALGNFTFDGDQTVGAGQDNYVLTYDNGTGLISLEAAAGGGGVTIGSNDQVPYSNSGGTDFDYGGLTFDGNTLTATYDDASTNTDLTVAQFIRTSSGTAGNDIGTRIELVTEDNGGTNRSLDVVHRLADSSSGSVDSEIEIQGFRGGNKNVNSVFLQVNSATNEVRLGPGSSTNNSSGIAISYGSALAFGADAISIGSGTASGADSIRIGALSAASSTEAISIGNNTQAAGTGTISLGANAGTTTATKNNYAINIGWNANGGDEIQGTYSIAIGRYTESAATGAFILGYTDNSNYVINERSNSFALAFNPDNTIASANALLYTEHYNGTTSDATANVVIGSIPIESDVAYNISVTIIGAETDGTPTEFASYVIHGTYENTGGTISNIGTDTVAHSAESTGGMDGNLNINGTNVEIRVTGVAGTNMNWTARVELTRANA